MQAEIAVENDDGIGVDVTDNDGVTHKIDIGREAWDIVYHEQDGYADDPLKRSAEGNARVGQARQFAKYYVYRERGYPTFESCYLPHNILATVLALEKLSDKEFESLFGEFKVQMGSHGNSEEMPVEVPAEMLAKDTTGEVSVFYVQDVYLDGDPEDAERLLAGGPSTDEFGDLDTEVVEALEEALEGGDDAGKAVANLASFEVDRVSGVYGFADPGGTEDPTWFGTDAQLEGEPHARIELPGGPGTLLGLVDGFRSLVSWHLLCQLRDFYVGLDLDPPEPFRILGLGRQVMTGYYVASDYYPDYGNPRADVPGYSSQRDLL